MFLGGWSALALSDTTGMPSRLRLEKGPRIEAINGSLIV